jgi:hypothetical protein
MKHTLGVVLGALCALVAGVTALAAPASGPVDHATALAHSAAPVASERSLTQTSVCDQGPANLPSTALHDLDEYAMDWGVFCEGATQVWMKENVATPALDGTALRCGIANSTPYANIHCYRNLLAQPAAAFSLRLHFQFTPTTCNNQGTPSIVQGIEFSVSRWQQATRYEFALQWQNVGAGAPQWRYWDPQQQPANRWVPFTPPISQCLSGAGWHTLVLEGMLAGAQMPYQVHYQGFMIDQAYHSLDISVPPAAALGELDRLAVAVQLDGNAAGTSYDLFIDQVDLNNQVYFPIIVK